MAITTDAIPIDQVPKDFDPNKTVNLTNPFKEEFTHNLNGVPYSVPAESDIQLPEPLAHHLAKHMAKKALIRPLRDKELKIREKDPTQAKGHINDKGVSPKEMDEYTDSLITSWPKPQTELEKTLEKASA